MIAQALAFGTILLAAVACARPAASDPAAIEISCAEGAVRLTEKDILRYDWESHTFWLAAADHARLFAALRARCVVSVAGSPLYEAEVVSPFDSTSRSTIVFIDFDAPPSDERPVEIRLGYPTAEYFTGVDLRASPALRNALQHAGKLGD